MLDRKAAKLFTGLGGAYCDLCHYSKADCANLTFIQFGFRITRDIEQIMNYVDENADEEGNIPRKQGDYDARAGITQKPIATHQVNSLQVLHTLLRTFDHFMQVVVHTKAAVFSWSASSWQSTFLDKSKVGTLLINSIKIFLGRIYEYQGVYKVVKNTHLFSVFTILKYCENQKFGGKFWPKPWIKAPSRVWDPYLPLVFSFQNNDEIWIFYCINICFMC